MIGLSQEEKMFYKGYKWPIILSQLTVVEQWYFTRSDYKFVRLMFYICM